MISSVAGLMLDFAIGLQVGGREGRGRGRGRGGEEPVGTVQYNTYIFHLLRHCEMCSCRTYSKNDRSHTLTLQIG